MPVAFLFADLRCLCRSKPSLNSALCSEASPRSLIAMAFCGAHSPSLPLRSFWSTEETENEVRWWALQHGGHRSSGRQPPPPTQAPSGRASPSWGWPSRVLQEGGALPTARQTFSRRAAAEKGRSEGQGVAMEVENLGLALLGGRHSQGDRHTKRGQWGQGWDPGTCPGT